MQFSFNFDSYEKSGKSKKDAIDYLKTLDSYVNFDKLEKDYNNDDDAIFDQLKKANITFRKKDTQANTQNTTNNQNANSSTEDTQNNALNANANSQNTTALNANTQNTTNNQNLNTQINEPEQPLNAKTNQTQGNTLPSEKNTQINAQNTQNEEEQKLAKKEEDLNHRGFWEKVKDDFLEETGAGQLMDLANEGLKKIGYDNKDYVTEDEKTQIYDKALNSARQKIANGGSYDDLTPLEKDILAKKDNTGTKAAFEKEQQRSEIEKKDKLDKKDMDLINSDLGFFNTLFNSDKESKKEWEEKRQSEGIISQDIQKAVNTLKQFDEGSLLKNVVFANKDEELQYKKNLLDDAYKIAELNGFNDVGMDKKGDIYFIKTDADGNEKKYLVNTGFFDNFMNMLNDSKFELAGGIAGALKGAKRGTSPMSKALNSIAGGALGSFAGAAADAKLADMYLNRESDFKKNLDYALQAGLLSAAGDGVMLGLTHGMGKAIQPIKTAVDKAGNLLSERTALGFLKTIPTQNIKAAENVIDEVFTPQMKEDLKAAKESLGGAVNGSDLQNPILEKLKDTFTKKYGANDEKTQKIAKLADIFNGNSLKTRQQDMLDLIRSDKEGTTLSYLLEVAKDDVKIQQNLKNMLNLSTSQVKRNLENLKINPYEIKQIMDDFETGNKNAFKEVENQISNLYDDKMKVVLDPSEYNKIKQEFIDNGVPLEEATPFLRDLENNVFSPDGVTFSKLNNFRKNLNYYIYNKDKTPNFVNSVKKLAEGTLKNEIDKGIDNIFKENPAAYDSIKKLYSSSLQDYAAMKELNESVKRLGLQDAQKSTDEVVDNLIKYAKGQGENGVNNLNKIKNYLGKDNHAFLEMQILNRIFKESMVENERAKLSVLDSDKFLNKVKELVGNDKENPLFTSKEAQDFLNIVEGFHKLYKNDASIAKNFTQTTAQKMGTSIATSAEGAIKQKVIKGAFDPIFRLLPEKIFFGMFSKQIQGGALRYHLKKALSRSLNYNDFKLKLEKELQKTHFNSKTKELLNDLMDNLDQFNKTKEEVLEAKALKEQEARDAELALIREQKEKQEEFFKQKEEEFGQEAINNNALKQGEAIEIQGLGNENSHLNASTEPSLKNTEENLNEQKALKESESENSHLKEEEIKTTREIINQAKANGLSVKETRKAVEANKALKEEKLKQEIKEAKEKHNALKDTESENSHLKEEETQNTQTSIDNTQNKQNVNSNTQNQPLKTQPQSKIFNQEENENIRNLEKEYREAYDAFDKLEKQNRERIDKWNERLEEDNKNIEEGFKSLGVEALKYDAFNHIFSRYGGLGGTGKNIRNIINDLRPHLTEEELKSLKDNEPLIEKIESLGKEALDLNAKIKDYSVLMREKHKGQHIVKEHREEHEAQQRLHKIREDLNDARVKRAYRLKELIEKNEPIRSKEEYNYINEALSDGPLKIMLDKKIKHLNKKMENFLKADEFNQSTTIQANQHLGAGLFGGMINGLSEDENGNLTFNPQDFLKGFAAGGVGSLGMNKALKVIKQNPQLKRNLLNELKKSLSITHGDLAKVYPVFKNTKPFKATKKDKALNIQAKAALRDLQIENMQDVLKNLNINPLPRELNEEEIQGLLKSFDNEKNIKEHLFTRTDAKLRKSLFRLLKDTQNDPQIHYIKNGRDKKLKRYKGDKDEPYFYVLITQDKDKTFITHFKNTNIKYLSRELINADKIIKDAATIETL